MNQIDLKHGVSDDSSPFHTITRDAQSRELALTCHGVRKHRRKTLGAQPRPIGGPRGVRGLDCSACGDRRDFRVCSHDRGGGTDDIMMVCLASRLLLYHLGFAFWSVQGTASSSLKPPAPEYLYPTMCIGLHPQRLSTTVSTTVCTPTSRGPSSLKGYPSYKRINQMEREMCEYLDEVDAATRCPPPRRPIESRSFAVVRSTLSIATST